MAKRIIAIIALMIVEFSLVACGSSNDVKNVKTTGTDTTESVSNQENLGLSNDNLSNKSDDSSENQKIDSEQNLYDNHSDDEIEKDYTYIDMKDIFIVDEIDIGDGIEINFDDMDLISGSFLIPESIDIYSFYGTYAGYTKPEIEIGSVKRNDKWVLIAFAKNSFLVKTEDFDRVAKDTLKNDNVVEDTHSNGTQSELVNNDINTTETVASSQENITQSELPIEANDYTAEQAIADYRAIMEANGITWDPSIKEFASWGTGMLPINKAEVEAGAYSSLESFAMGDSVGHPWTKYYLEVTGSDENYVYVTSYVCD